MRICSIVLPSTRFLDSGVVYAGIPDNVPADGPIAAVLRY